VVNSREENADSIGSPLVDSTLQIQKGFFPRVHLNGTRIQSGLTFYVTDAPFYGSIGPLMMRPATFRGSFGVSAVLTTATLVAKAIANANPNRPVVDIPVNLLELRDLPGLLRDAGRIAHGTARPGSKAAKANLMAQFGVAPIISDLVKLLSFTESVAKRERYLSKLNSEKPYRIRRKITEEHSVGVFNGIPWPSTAENSTTFNKATLTTEVTDTYWYTLRAHLSALITEREIQTHAFKSVLGLDAVTASSAWELLPWSWLIDWFSNTGDILAAYRGGIPWTWSGLNIMCRSDFVFKVSFPSVRPTMVVNLPTPQGWGKVLRRTPSSLVSIYPEFSLPYLEWKQWSILGSLAILKL